MRRAGPDPDRRVHIRPAGARFSWLGRWRAAKAGAGLLALLLVLLLGRAGFQSWLHHPPAIPIDTETEAQIDQTQPCAIKVSHFAPDPAVVVIDFPNLTQQGLMLDRVAALVEKAHLPRNRVLADAPLREAIYSCGDTIESYYYGHDYKAADLARFFALAGQDGVKLNRQELWLKQLVTQLGWLKPGANGALITLPAATAPVTQEMREVILHHELSHGAFFTVPAYAAYAAQFWNGLNASEQAGFRNFLGNEGYDTSNSVLMLNEAQAYLIFTQNPKFFTPAAVGLTVDEVTSLRASFIAAMPNFWLKLMATASLPPSTNLPACQAPS